MPNYPSCRCALGRASSVALLAVGLASPAFAGQQAPKPVPDNTLYAVATAHLDTQWNWTIQTTIQEYIPRTLLDNFEFFEKFPHYVFSFEGAFRYMLMNEYYPKEFARLKDYVKQGRWRVAGSSVDAGDSNVVSPESLFRHVLYGNGYFEKTFAKTSLDFFLPDSFGFSYVMPSVAAHCGLLGFSSQKLTWGAAEPIPFNIGRWAGPDGGEIVAVLNPGGYSTKLKEEPSSSTRWINRVKEEKERIGLAREYMYYGIGDRGGAPTTQSVALVEKSATSSAPLHVYPTGSDQFYRDLTKEQRERMPRYQGELIMEYHGTGCYTAQTQMKRWNRKNEQLADAAERASVAAQWLGTSTYPLEKLNFAWIRFLWHQFHDDLTGTSIPNAYLFSWNDEAISNNTFRQVLTDACAGISSQMDTRGAAQGSVPVVVYNPLSIERQDLVQAKLSFPASASPKSVSVTGPDGKQVPAQLLDSGDVLFLASVAPLSWSVYQVTPASAQAAQASQELQVTSNTLENGRYRVALDEQGDVASIRDKVLGRELLEKPIKLEFFNDVSTTYPAWEVIYKDVAAGPKKAVAGPAQIRVAENGPARVALEVTRKAKGSSFTQRVRLGAGQAGDRVEFDNFVDWKSRQALLKASFPVAAKNTTATYDLQLGAVQRPNNSQKRYEVPAQQWADLTNADNSFGVTVMNDCKYGWDKPDDSTLRLTLFHTPKTGKRYQYQEVEDFGPNKFVFAVAGHKGSWQDETSVAWSASRVNQPLLAFEAPSHKGALGKSFSMLKVSTPQVAVRALKKAENGQGIIVRLQELTGKPASQVTLDLTSEIAAAREVNGSEKEIAKGDLYNGTLAFNMKPFQTRTFALKLAPSETQPATPKSKPVTLEYNVAALSGDNAAPAANFAASGNSIPAELFPKEIVSEDIRFAMGPKDKGAKNMVACRGQKIQLSAEGANRVYILATSTNGDTTGTFKLGDKAFDLGVQNYTGRIAQYVSPLKNDEYTSNPAEFSPQFLKRAPIAWVATHLHKADGTNIPYEYCYLYRYEIDLPQGVNSLTLPDNDGIKIAAVTLAQNPKDKLQPVSPTDEEIYGVSSWPEAPVVAQEAK